MAILGTDDFQTIDEVIAEFMRDAEMAERLKAARRHLAPILYPQGGPDFERMLRGDPPNTPNTQEGR